VTKETTVSPGFLDRLDEMAREEHQVHRDLLDHHLKGNIFQFLDLQVLPDLLVHQGFPWEEKRENPGLVGLVEATFSEKEITMVPGKVKS